MPDKTGYFSKEEQDTIKSWIEGKAKEDFCCHTCNAREFSLYSHLVSAPISGSGGVNISSGFEVVGVVCTNCGVVTWYNADTIGVGTDSPYWDPETDSENAKEFAPRSEAKK